MHCRIMQPQLFPWPPKLTGLHTTKQTAQIAGRPKACLYLLA